MEIVYFDPHLPSQKQTGFREGEAWWVDAQSELGVCINRLEISPYTYYGLLFCGLEEAFQRLPGDGMIGTHEEGVIFPAGLKEFSQLLCRAGDALDQETLDVPCTEQIQPIQKQYRIK